MRLSHRPARAEDLAVAFATCGDAFAYPEALRPHVPRVWREWLADGRLLTCVVEDHADLGATPLLGLGATVFVTPEFAARARRSAEPYLRAELVRRWLDGRHDVLSAAEARTANARGELVLFFANDALSNRALSDEALHLVHEKWSESLYEFRSVRLREILWEVNSRKLQQWSAGCGLHLRRDWTEYWRERGGARDDDRRPYLVGLTREEAVAEHGTHGSYLFLHVAPRFGFTERQQELLRAALAGETDEELARTLHLSVPAVKKRWVAVYEQVSAAAPGWLEKPGTASGSSRGAEKRRRLLHYLRQHPEELHPVNAEGPRREAARRGRTGPLRQPGQRGGAGARVIVR